MADPFSGVRSADLDGPIRGGAAVTPSDDSEDDFDACRALWIGGAGDVSVETIDGDELVFVGVAAGTLLPVRAVRVNDTGTDATEILRLF